MRFDIVSIFPDFFSGFMENGILRRALSEGLVEIRAHDLREFTHDRHRTVDDRPFGGGEGMVLKPEPLAEAFAAMGIAPKAERERLQVSESASQQISKSAEQLDGEVSGAAEPARTRVILLSAQGRPFTQAIARELATLDRVVLVCGRYEGVDERVNELYCDEEISIGDYVLSGGELAAAVLIDAAMRLIPGVLGNQASSEYESFGVADAEIDSDVDGVPRSQHGAGGLLDYPHYTRPAEFAGLKTPAVLLNGDHLEIRKWRRAQQLRKTLVNRPDLLEKAALSKQDLKLLEEIRNEEPL
jgi:tRNA (guanine37-N1)-methyltransferase